MAKQKATHYGHCQVCGAKQKLPAGRLAKHGYQVARWGFFMGTCSGSDHRPFEQDISLIEGAIAYAQARSEELVAFAANTRALTEKVWVHEYVPATWQTRHSTYVWRQLELSEVTFEFRGAVWKGKSEKNASYPLYMEYGEDTNAHKVAKLNELRAKAYDKDVEELARYIDWQQKRILDWKPSELEPIAK